MQQPELGLRLTSLRREQNLTQEELVAKSNVSVRTIQRIEAGEVLPRMSTIKILLNALGHTYESFSTKQPNTMETQTTSQNFPSPNRTTLLIAAIAGVIYLVTAVILGAMDVAWLASEEDWQEWTNYLYIGLKIIMVGAYILFARGFITLSEVFENTLLKIAGYLMIAAVTGLAILDVSSLYSTDYELLLIPYCAAAVILGSLTIVFGVALMRLQDGMGEVSRVAGILEILIGCALVTVILFFIGYIMMVPAIVVEILVLYRGYEYLSRSSGSQVA
jgi:transcriptional regulator with XRE-family HTH domain